ncbi:MAG: hypothetical protein JW821_02965 [Deltaproteobacteria bacterium]|nr:hypothetical protein [Deltaproteobacteria bacterium]
MKHRLVILFVLVEMAAAAGLFLHGRVTARRLCPGLEISRQVVKALSLTDPALWTEAHYTRNPTQSDRFAPFQDFPGALEHFPAGSLVQPPGGRWKVVP